MTMFNNYLPNTCRGLPRSLGEALMSCALTGASANIVGILGKLTNASPPAYIVPALGLIQQKGYTVMHISQPIATHGQKIIIDKSFQKIHALAIAAKSAIEFDSSYLQGVRHALRACFFTCATLRTSYGRAVHGAFARRFLVDGLSTCIRSITIFDRNWSSFTLQGATK